ncbi:acyltransferase [Kitasatospora arboriphila]|uniref:Acyltransferase n=1 Tax=Kitasatospora arboriphila TaxID=258052 RepID=A0ABN1T8U4_9ACTN
MSALAVRARLSSLPTLADVWSGRRNGFGLLRLVFSVGVIIEHARPLGFHQPEPLKSLSRHQVDLGALCVAGFFLLSGLLITRSAMRTDLRRFLWARAVRILPGFWACLLVTVLVIGPIVAWRSGMSLHDYFTHPEGPWRYLRKNCALAMNQFGLSGLLADNPYPKAFDGSLWSLSSEVFCYLVVGGLAALGILRRNRAVVLVMLAGALLFMASLAVKAPHLRANIYAETGHGAYILPLIGWLSLNNLLPLMFMFGLGAAAELYRERLPIHWAIAAVCAVLFGGSMRFGGFTLIGLPALAYLIVWTAVRTPSPLTRIGAKADFSYGLYIYAFPVQQTLVLFHGTRWGFWPYVALSTAVALGMAACSWYLVEQPTLRLKDKNLDNLTPPFLHRRRKAGDVAADAAPEAQLQEA